MKPIERSATVKRPVTNRSRSRRARYALLGLALMMVLALLGAQAHAQDPVVLRYWQQGVSAVPSLEKEIALFEEANPGIEVEMTTTGGAQYTQVLNLAFRSGNGPDVFNIPTDGITFQQVLANDWMLPLNKWATPAWQKTFPEGSFVESSNVFDGNVYSAPWDGKIGNRYPLFINNEVFREAGLVDASGEVLVPRTWDEARQYAKQIVERSGGDVFGYGFGAKTGDFPLALQARGVLASGVPSAGPDGFNYRTGRYEFASNPVWQQWFDHWIDMKEDGSLFPQSAALDDEQARVLFAEGLFGMYVNGPWVPNSLAETNPGFEDYTIAQVPTLTGKASSFFYVQPGGRKMAISSTTQHPEEAWKLFDFLNSKASATRWVGYGEGLRVWPDTAEAATGRAVELAKIGLSNTRLAPAFNELRPQLLNVTLTTVTPNLPTLVLAAFNGQLRRDQVSAALQKLEDDSNAMLDAAIEEARNAGSEVTRDDFKFSSWNPLVNQTEAN